MRLDTLIDSFANESVGNYRWGIYIVKIDVQGFELDVLRGLMISLREKRVLYILLEFWPSGMRKNARVDAADVLSLLHSFGYALFDTRVLSTPIQGDGGFGKMLPTAATFPRPVGFRQVVDWYNTTSVEHKSQFGYWTDVVAVASGALDLNMY